MRAILLTYFVHSRGFALITGLLALVLSYVFFSQGDVAAISGDHGFALLSANEWISGPGANALSSLVANALVVAGMALCGKLYNVLRTMTMLPVSLFLALQIATPDLFLLFYTGTVLCVLVPACQLLLYSCYRAPDRTRRVFLIFTLLSLASATQYCYLVYIPVFLLGCAQMRIFNGRTLVAAMLGIVTPWWILFGFGIISPEDMHMPDFVSIFSEIDFNDTLLLLGTLALTVLLAIASFVLNVLKTIAYNARIRAYSGFFAILTLATVIAMCADYRNIISYVPLLNYCAAYQIAHYFTAHRADRSYVAVLSVVGVYIVLCLCQTVTSI